MLPTTTQGSQASPISQASTGDSDSVLSKLKSRLGSVDEDESAPKEAIAKLIPGHSRRKEKRRLKARKQAIEDDGSESPQGRSSHGELATSSRLGANESHSSLGYDYEDGNSMMTSDSDAEQT